MHLHEPIELLRDCGAIAIPSGVEFTMEKGTRVIVMQALGGSYTVSSSYGLSRISEKDRDALVTDASSLPPEHPLFSKSQKEASSNPAEPVTEEKVWEALKTVYDPEIPVNIVDLGLVYSIEVMPLGSGACHVAVKMTLTAPGCGMGPVIQADAKQKILDLPGVEQADVELVWEPAWNQDRMSEAGKMKLGFI